MKILTLGWEYAPKISGGLGVACQGLTEAMAAAGHEVTFLLPKKVKGQVSKKVKLVDASETEPNPDIWKKKKEHIEIIKEVEIGQYLLPYLPPQTFTIAKEKQKIFTTYEDTGESEILRQIKLTGEYEGNLQAELFKYALLAVQLAKEENYDVVHAHDWVTFKAGMMVKEMAEVPFVAHLHSTEFDRNGVHAQDFIIREEQKGLQSADHIFCVSHQLRETVCSRYNIPRSKISVAPNASLLKAPKNEKPDNPKNIAFVGRLTHQKSPATFIDIARDLTSRGHDFQYFVIGDGYLKDDLESKVAGSNFASRIKFTGFLNRKELLKTLGEMDLLITPSTAEPFGLVILEAILKNIPVAAARGTGVAEFIPSLPQVDRWDHYSYVKLVEKLMTNDEMRSYAIQKCREEAGKLSWKGTAALVTTTLKQIVSA